MSRLIVLGCTLMLVLQVVPSWSEESEAGIKWLHDMKNARLAASSQGKYILLDVYADWCGPCKMMDRSTWTDPAVIAAVTKQFIPLKIDSDTNRDIVGQYGVDSLPTVMLLTAQGTPFAQEIGYQSAEKLLGFLDEGSKLEAKLKELRDTVEKNPDDIAAALELAKLQLLFDHTEESIQLLQRYQKTLDQDTPSDLRGRFDYQLGVAYLMAENYEKGLETLRPFLTTYKDHDLSDAATEMYGMGTLEYARAHVEEGQNAEGRQLLVQLAAYPDQPYLKRLAESSLAMLDAIEAKQQELEVLPKTATE